MMLTLFSLARPPIVRSDDADIDKRGMIDLVLEGYNKEENK